MIAFFEQLNHWDWLALGCLLLVLEVLGGAGYLLWMGLSATAIGLLTFIFPDLDWSWQLIAFALLSLYIALLWWYRLRQSEQPEEAPNLNQRGSELIGRSFELHEPISAGRGKIRAGDSLWLVQGPDLPAGSRVRVHAQEGVILQVEPCDSTPETPATAIPGQP